MTDIVNESGSTQNSLPQEETPLLHNEQPQSSYATVNQQREEEQRSEDTEQQRSKKHRISLIIVAVILSTTVIATVWIASHYKSLRNRSYRPHDILNNGTHDFKQTLVMISLDGTVNDYLDQHITPNIDSIAAQGVRAQYMNPSFPSVTFPNHWSLVTGLYPETHGIVGNVFYDPVTNETFNYKSENSWQSKWWGGEPIWITSELQNVTSAVTMWPGCSSLLKGKRPTYEIPYSDDVTSDEKVDQVLDWLDLPYKERPQTISVYIPTVDQHGHKYGPYDNRTLDALHAVDATIGRLLRGLETRNLSDIIHVIIVSDHGMSESDNSRLIYYDDILDNKALDNIWKIEGWPLLGIRPYPGRGEEATIDIYKQFYNASLQPDAKYEVFLRSNMPQKYHFSNSERISPVIAIPRDGWNFVTRKQFSDPTKVYEPRGVHGYDNFARQSRAIFVAKGPLFDWDFIRGSKLKPFGNIEVYNVLSRILGLSPAPNNGTLNGHLKALEL